MGLGLLGHLKDLSTMTIYDYLSKGHETTSVGLLLGMAAAQRGTMDAAVAKMLSIHVPALLPASSTEIDVAPMVQTAALVGVGLLYQETAHRRITEVLLDQIDRPAGVGLNVDLDRESYSLAAGLALGTVNLARVGVVVRPRRTHVSGLGSGVRPEPPCAHPGACRWRPCAAATQGGTAPGLADLRIADRLHRYFEGGREKRRTAADGVRLAPPPIEPAPWHPTRITSAHSCIRGLHALPDELSRPGGRPCQHRCDRCRRDACTGSHLPQDKQHGGGLPPRGTGHPGG